MRKILLLIISVSIIGCSAGKHSKVVYYNKKSKEQKQAQIKGKMKDIGIDIVGLAIWAGLIKTANTIADNYKP
jgi:hypothetical protein